jgi:small subunit ribosomal protein S2
LTNFPTIKKRLKYLQELEEKTASEEFQTMSNKEKRVISKELEGLMRTWGGLRKLEKTPQALFLLDVANNYLAIKEAKRKGIKVIAICDTDSDIREIDYPIPANDDALPAIEYIMQSVKDVIKEAKESRHRESGAEKDSQ